MMPGTPSWWSGRRPSLRPSAISCNGPTPSSSARHERSSFPSRPVLSALVLLGPNFSGTRTSPQRLMSMRSTHALIPSARSGRGWFARHASVVWNFDPRSDEEPDFETLFDDPYVVLAGADSPWARKCWVGLAELLRACDGRHGRGVGWGVIFRRMIGCLRARTGGETRTKIGVPDRGRQKSAAAEESAFEEMALSVRRRVVLEHSAGDQVIEEHADGLHVLLEGGGRKAVRLGGFEIVARVERTDVLYALLAAILQERKERAERPAVCPPGVLIVDGGAQEVLDAVTGLAAGALDQGGWPTLAHRSRGEIEFSESHSRGA